MAAASKSPSTSANNSLGVEDFPVAADANFENSKNGGPAKKPAWKKPSNGAATTVAAEVGAVMGADSWPALSDSASRSSPKPSLLPLNGSVVESEEMPPVSPPPQKEPTSMQGTLTEAQRHNAGSSGGSARDHNKEDTHRAHWQRGRPFGDNEQHSQNGPLRSNNGPRGDGFQHHRHGARRDNHRRENFASQRRDGPRPFVRGPVPPNGPFAPPPPPMVLSSLFNPVFYSELPPVYYVSPHLDTHRMVTYSPMFMHPSDPNLYTKILSQIDYYFSNENLVKDTFLRGKMDSEGWVSINVIAGFTKVKLLTSSVDLILDAIQASNVVEVQGDKVRRKNDWNRWLMPRDQYFATTSHSAHGSNQK